MKKQKEKNRKKRRLRISTYVTIVILLAALIVTGFTYADLFHGNISQPKTVKSQEADSTDDPGRKVMQRVDPEETDVTVVNEDTAWEALDQLKRKYGIRNVKDEYRIISSSETEMSRIYWFQQKYANLIVFGHQMKLITDTEGTVKSMNGNYADLHGMDTTFILSEDEAVDYALNYMAKTCKRSKKEFFAGEKERGIYAPGDKEEPQVCYRFTVSGIDVSKRLIISGSDGKVLAEESTITTAEEAVELQGQTGLKKLRAFKNADNTYSLYDSDYNIYVIDNEALYHFGDVVYPPMDDSNRDEIDKIVDETGQSIIDGIGQDLDTINLSHESVVYNENEYPSKSGADVLANLEKAVDYFSSQFSREGGVSKAGLPLVVEINAKTLSYVLGNPPNGGWAGKSEKGYSLMMFNPRQDENSTDLCANVDVVGHEFTHGIVMWDSALSEDGQDNTEADAINEGLADVFGELIQDYADDGLLNNSNREWFFDLAGDGRDIAHALSPQRGDALVTLASEYTGDNAESHIGSAIISYPAYLMTRGINNADIGKLYYETISKLKAGNSFEDFRVAFDNVLIEKNDAGSIRDDAMECAIDAIDMSGIEPNSSLCKYKVAKKGKLMILDKYGDPYDDYFITIRKGKKGKCLVDREESSEGFMYTLPSSIVPGYYSVTLEDKKEEDSRVAFDMLVNDNVSEASGRIQPYNDQQEVKTPFNGKQQEIVFVLDSSGSMSGDPIDSAKNASMNCVESILTSDPASRISVIGYSGSPSTLIQSSNNMQQLLDSINGLSSGGETNTYAAIEAAGNILKDTEKKDARKKIIVLLSDGQPTAGPSEDGDYHKPIADLTKDLKDEGILFYTVGSFSALDNEESVDAENLMREVASPGYDYNIESDEIQDVFHDISEVINGATYQSVRIACPVDVQVTSGGETLNSSKDDLNKRTAFGYLSFEGDEDDPTKILRLKNDGTDYDICITGTGKGFMDYSISYPDQDGEYKDTRTFEKIPVSKGTFITTGTGKKLSSSLQVDSDGNGSIDRAYSAFRNGKGKTTSSRTIGYLIMAGVVLMLLYAVRKGTQVYKRIKINSVCESCNAQIKAKWSTCPYCGARHTYENPFFPEKVPFKKQKKWVLAVKAVLIVIGLSTIMIMTSIRRTAPFATFDQIQNHRLSSAATLYKNGVKGRKVNEKVFRVLLDPYMQRVDKAHDSGKIQDAYYRELSETAASMGYGKKSR